MQFLKQKLKYPYFFILLILLCFIACQTNLKRLDSSHQLTLRDESYLNEIRSKFNSNSTYFHSKQLGYLLYDPESTKTVESQNENLSFIPASTTKLLTAIAALKILGPHYQFNTLLAYRGKIRNEILHGDLYLKGEGDPSLTVSHLMSLAKSLKDNHIHQISGNYYFDESETPPLRMIKEGSDFSSSYNPGLGALSVDFNQIFVHWRPSDESQSKIDVYFTPDLPLFEIQLLPDSPQEQLDFKFEQNKNSERWLMPSQLKSSGEKRLPVKSPNLLTALLFSKFCKMNGINLPFPQSRKLPPNTKVMITHQSAPLIEISERILEYSNNMMAELVLLKAAQKMTGQVVPLTEASQILKEWTKTHVESSQWEFFHLSSGSGLTPNNRVTPSQLVNVLKYADQFRFNNRTFESLLPISGWKGGLSQRLGLPETEFRVWAKTGSMLYANTLAGYLYTLKGKRLIFAIMSSDFKEREKINRFADFIPLEIEDKANEWTKNMRKLQDELVRRWISIY